MPDLYLLCHPTELCKSSNTGQLLPGLQVDTNSADNNSADTNSADTNAADRHSANSHAATGNLANSSAADEPRWRSYQISWQRKQPDPQLIAALQRGGAVLLYPSANAQAVDLDCPLPLQLAAGQALHSVIVLDATWQLAQKMFNQSPYLHALPHWHAHSQYQSVFTLRRNQRAGAWCTAETVALLWQASGALLQADELWQRFYRFNQR